MRNFRNDNHLVLSIGTDVPRLTLCYVFVSMSLGPAKVPASGQPPG